MSTLIILECMMKLISNMMMMSMERRTMMMRMRKMFQILMLIRLLRKNVTYIF